MARGSDKRRRANLSGQNYYWLAPRPGQKSHHDQVLESARRYRSQLEPDLTTRWRSFWSWVLINDHVRLALVAILVPLIAALLALEAYRLEGPLCWGKISPLWQVVLGCGGLAVTLLTVVLTLWRRWERKVRPPRTSPEPPIAETERIPPRP